MSLDDQILDFLTDLDAMGPRGPGVRYADELIERACQLVHTMREQGWTQHTIAETLQITWVTLSKWRQAREPELLSSFSPVSLAPSHPESSSGICLVSPSGWRIEGLSTEQALALVTRL